MGKYWGSLFVKLSMGIPELFHDKYIYWLIVLGVMKEIEAV